MIGTVLMMALLNGCSTTTAGQGYSEKVEAPIVRDIKQNRFGGIDATET